MEQTVSGSIGQRSENKFFAKSWESQVCQVILWKTLVVMSNGFVLTFLWKWYVSDVFGLKTISFITASGVVLTVNLVTQHLQTFFVDPTIKTFDGLNFGLIDGTSMTLDVDPARRKKMIWQSRTWHLMRPVAYLLIGWVIHFLQ